MHRVTHSRVIASWAVLPLVIVGLLEARPASAYVGNYKALYWSGYRYTALGSFSRAASRYRSGLKEQHKWWQRLDRTIDQIERTRDGGTLRRQDIVDMELEYLRLRTDFHEALERRVQAEIDELTKPDGGLIAVTLEQRRLVYPFEKEAVMLEVAAARAEQNKADFARARELWAEAIAARQRGAEAVSAALEGLRAKASSEEAPEAEGGRMEAQIEYLEGELERFSTLAEKLQGELDWAADPVNVLGRMRYFEGKTTFYSGMYEKVYRDLAEFYRAKAAYACDLVAATDPGRADEMADLKEAIIRKREASQKAVVPTWYYPVEYELPLYEFSLGAEEKFGPLPGAK